MQSNLLHTNERLSMHSVYPDSYTSCQGRLVDAKSKRQPQCESVVYAYSNQISTKKENAILLCCAVNAL
jgi:hypothetical protein